MLPAERDEVEQFAHGSPEPGQAVGADARDVPGRDLALQADVLGPVVLPAADAPVLEQDDGLATEPVRGGQLRLLGRVARSPGGRVGAAEVRRVVALAHSPRLPAS